MSAMMETAFPRERVAAGRARVRACRNARIGGARA